MYAKWQKAWEKHIDFILLDLLCMMLTLYLGYIWRHGTNIFHGSNSSLYWRLMVILILVDICVVFFGDSYKGIIRRGYLTEFKQTFRHCIAMDFIILVALFLTQQTGEYSRETLLIFGVLQLPVTYIVRCLRKHAVRVKMLHNPYVEQMLILTEEKKAQSCIEKLMEDKYRNYRVAGVVVLEKQSRKMDDIWQKNMVFTGETAGCEKKDKTYFEANMESVEEAAASSEVPLKEVIGMGEVMGTQEEKAGGMGEVIGIQEEKAGGMEEVIGIQEEKAGGMEEVIGIQEEKAGRVGEYTVEKERGNETFTAGLEPLGFSQLSEYLLNHVVDSVFVNVSLEEKEMAKLLQILVNAGVVVHINLAERTHPSPNSTVEQIGDFTVMTAGMRIATTRQYFFKRAMDIAGGIVGSIITLVATLFLAPVIYLQSPGPVFFRQERVGKNGRIFEIYKFRSMYVDAEERKKELLERNQMDGFMFKIKDDPRITPVGRILRRYSIDELPQFFNVLKGDMSLVGTRPPTRDEFEKYQLHHRGRLGFRPGITGLWQVSGRNSITDFERVVELDTEYIMNWSISEDIRILWKTVKQVVRGDGT